MNDLQMTRDSDLCILDHDIIPTDSIEQGIYIRLRWWFGEWKFGPEYGVRYFEDILVKNPNNTIIVSGITKQLMAVEGVKAVNRVNVVINHKERSAVIKYSVATEDKERFEREVKIWSMV